MKIIAYIGASILILFGVLFILSAFSPQGQTSNLVVGVILVIIAFVIIFFVTRKKKVESNTTNVTLNIDLPGNVSLDSLKCQQCGGILTKDSISLVNGAPMVSCPYCNTTYQLTEEPKW
jgi:Ca2+/Na+ antiporter